MQRRWRTRCPPTFTGDQYLKKRPYLYTLSTASEWIDKPFSNTSSAMLATTERVALRNKRKRGALLDVRSEVTEVGVHVFLEERVLTAAQDLQRHRRNVYPVFLSPPWFLLFLQLNVFLFTCNARHFTSSFLIAMVWPWVHRDCNSDHNVNYPNLVEICPKRVCSRFETNPW